MPAAWLERKRKQEIIDLSREAGVEIIEDGRKDELIEALEAFLKRHITALSRNPSFEGYYAAARPRGATPFRSSSGAVAATSDGDEVKSVVKSRGRRTTVVKDEPSYEPPLTATSPDGRIARLNARIAEMESRIPLLSSPTRQLVSPPSSSALLPQSRTPRTSISRPNLPASPADVATLVDNQTASFYAGLSDLYSVSGLPGGIERLQDFTSTVQGIHLSILLLEGFALSPEVLPFIWVADSPAIAALGIPSYPLSVPNLFLMLNSWFWYPVLTWLATSLAIPLLFAYFYNLTIRDVRRNGARVSVARYTYDPMTFSIVKSVLSYLVYGRGQTFGVFSEAAAARVEYAVLGGTGGLVTGAVVGAIASLYEATQRR